MEICKKAIDDGPNIFYVYGARRATNDPGANNTDFIFASNLRFKDILESDTDTKTRACDGGRVRVCGHE